jgi:hypothetical protein
MPIKLPSTVVLIAALNWTPPMVTPVSAALITLPAPDAVPPIVTPFPISMSIPVVAEPIAAVPEALVPI